MVVGAAAVSCERGTSVGGGGGAPDEPGIFVQRLGFKAGNHMKISLAGFSWNSRPFSHGKGVRRGGSIPLANGLVELAARRFVRSLVCSFVHSLVRLVAQL